MKSIIIALLLTLPVFATAETVRSPAQVRAFKKTHVCPSSGVASTKPCKGYVVDHIIPLACGGPDLPSNMQYQTIAEGKAKDKWELKGCKK